MSPEDEMDFEACRFDFRLDAKNGLTPSKRKKSERRGTCYNTLFKCKVCGSLYDNRAALLEHKLIHNDHKCPICDVKVARKATLQEHLNVIHGLGKVKTAAPQEGESGKIDQKAALREHIRVVRGLVRKARGGKSQQAAGREQKAADGSAQTLQAMSPPSEPMTLAGFSTNGQQPFQPPMHQVPMSMASPAMTPPSMPGYVYINVPVVMQGDQKDPNQSAALPANPMSYIPNFQGYPGFPQAANPMTPVKCEKKYELPTLAAAISQNNLVKVKQEPNETTGGMTLPHFPVPQTIDDLEPGEIRPMSRVANPPGFGNTMGMQLPTMVKLEDYQNSNSQTQGLSHMISGHPEVTSQPMPQTTPHYIDLSTGNVINIQPQQINAEKTSPVNNAPQPYSFENSDFGRKPAFISTSFTADDDNCVVDLSMDNSKSDSALAERLSLTSQTFSNTPMEYIDPSQQSEDGVLDLSKKPCKDSSSEIIKTQDTNQIETTRDLAADMGIPSSSPRPSSAASSTSDSSNLKQARKARSGGLNSMVARLWQTKIQKTKEETDVGPDNKEDIGGGGGDGTEHNPIMLAEGDESMIEDTQQTIEKLKLANDSPEQSTEAPMVEASPKRKNENEEARKARRKRPKPDYCCITYHSCKVCKQLFESADAMWEHALQHADFYNERCDYCDFSAPTKEAIQDHCSQAHGVTVQKEDCKRTRSEGKQKEYPCKVCGKSLRSPAGLQVHMVRHDEAADRQYTCDFKDCHATFTNQRDCLSHSSRVHKGENSSQRRYQCPHEGCTKNYAKRDGLKHHLMSHTGERPLACNYPGCKKTFREAKHLKVHRLRHTDEKPMQCKLCEYACRQRTSMNWHMKTRHGLEKSRTAGNRTIYMNSNTVVIESCESGTAVNTNGDPTVYTEEEVMFENGGMAMEELETEDEMESPIPSSTDDSCAEDGTESNSGQVSVSVSGGGGEDGALNLTLPLRPDGFESDESGLSAMVAPMQGISAEANFFANVVRMRYPGFNQNLDGKQLPHATETKFHTCKICKQLFENVEKMWSHRLVEHDEICKFYCDVCGYNTDNRGEFESHMSSTHNREVTDVKEFVCLWCGREYSSRHGLKQHLLMKHAGDGNPTYPCPYDNCENQVLSKQALKLHIQRRHIKARQEAAAAAAAAELPCPVDGCSRTFENVTALRGHQATHSEERPLVCDFPGCDKTFREAKHLKVHKMLHTDERPLKCLQCQYSCRQRNSMNWHMKSKHAMQKQVSADGRTIYVPM